MWLLQSEALARIEATSEASIPITFAASPPGELSVDGVVASFPVNGVLTPKPNRFLAFLFGASTSYQEINEHIAAANADPRVKEIHMRVGSSPGGNVEGMIPTMDAIRESAKPVTAFVEESAHSATYGLISQAKGGVYAAHRATMFGSVGVKAKVAVDGSVVELANTESPLKVVDASTDEGKEQAREPLNQVFAIFAETIALGRGIDKKEVVRSFGRGASFPAGIALANGMIDGVGLPSGGTSSAGQTEESMNLQELKAAHPELVEAIKAEAVGEEQERVNAHLVLGEASGDMAQAVKDIQAGKKVTQETNAYHTAASIRAARAANLVGDNASADLGATAAAPVEVSDEDKRMQAIADGMTWADGEVL